MCPLSGSFSGGLTIFIGGKRGEERTTALLQETIVAPVRDPRFRALWNLRVMGTPSPSATRRHSTQAPFVHKGGPKQRHVRARGAIFLFSIGGEIVVTREVTEANERKPTQPTEAAFHKQSCGRRSRAEQSKAPFQLFVL